MTVLLAKMEEHVALCMTKTSSRVTARTEEMELIVKKVITPLKQFGFGLL